MTLGFSEVILIRVKIKFHASRLYGWTQTNCLWDSTDQNRRFRIGQVATLVDL